MKTIQTLKTPLYVTNMKIAAENMWIFYLKLSAYNILDKTYVNSSYLCKIIHSFLTDTYLGNNFKFPLNLDRPANEIKCFPMYYKQIFKR